MNSAKIVLKKLTDLTGRASLPLMSALGFHFSKWDTDLKVEKVIDKDELFEGRQFPVDFFWMDIGHTKQNRYFMFNPDTFPLDKVTKLNLQIKERERRLVVITDPHV